MHICHQKNIYRKGICTTPAEKHFKVNEILIGKFGDKNNRNTSVSNQNIQTFSLIFQKQHHFGRTWKSRSSVLFSGATSKKFRKGVRLFQSSYGPFGQFSCRTNLQGKNGSKNVSSSIQLLKGVEKNTWKNIAEFRLAETKMMHECPTATLPE